MLLGVCLGMFINSQVNFKNLTSEDFQKAQHAIMLLKTYTDEHKVALMMELEAFQRMELRKVEQCSSELQSILKPIMEA